MANLLIELFSEEIPARMQAQARGDLKSMVTNGLVEAGLTYASAGGFSTPRRLVLAVEGVTAESAAVREERKGPSATAPQAAIDGFLRSTGLTVDQLERRADKKGETLYAVIEKPGRAAPAIIADVLDHTIRNFPWPKSMRWGSGNLRWVRPLHSILCQLTDEAGSTVVPLTVDGITSGNTTQGHRFMAPGVITVSGFDDYSTKLKRAFVVLDADERAAAILQSAQNMAFAAGMELVPDAGLLAEVAGLVEWPVVLLGRIDPAFLGLPPEVLQTSMREHQKFFSLRNPKTARIEGFVTVANVETADHGATILAGNQKVLSARLSDARFFWENDLRVARAGMGEWLEGLKSVTFHNKLGSQSDRIARIAALAREIAPMVGADPDLAHQAATFAKADLRSAMVGEFPELQGLMGMYYARAAGLPEAVALAARDHWKPKGESDSVSTDPVSVAVALADKIDTLTGFWAIDEKPTGSKDPFALRRAALGVIRLVVGNGLRLNFFKFFWQCIDVLHSQFAQDAKLVRWSDDLEDLPSSFEMESPRRDAVFDVQYAFVSYLKRPLETVESALSGQGARMVEHVRNYQDSICGPAAVISSPYWSAKDLIAFFHDRLKTYLRDENIRHDVINACMEMPGNDDLTLLAHRARALSDFLKTPDGPNLIQGTKRASTILAQAEAKDGVEYSYGADPKFAETDEERALFTALDHAEPLITTAMKSEDFATAMTAMATLRAPIDGFFNTVQVNTENQITRRNRLNLLHRIRTICAGVADLTKIEG